MGLEIIATFLACKSGDELFEKITSLLRIFNINTVDTDGNVRNVYEVLCDIAEVINNDNRKT